MGCFRQICQIVRWHVAGKRHGSRPLWLLCFSAASAADLPCRGMPTAGHGVLPPLSARPLDGARPHRQPAPRRASSSALLLRRHRPRPRPLDRAGPSPLGMGCFHHFRAAPVDAPPHAGHKAAPCPNGPTSESIMIIGAGPIVIGQACEFDYSGTQACKALRAGGLPGHPGQFNPATIMTDPELADATYVEPITPEVVARIIERERPDALLPTMGGADRPQHRHGARQAPARLQAARRRADRRQRPRHRDGRGPRAVPPGHGPHRPREPEGPHGRARWTRPSPRWS